MSALPLHDSRLERAGTVRVGMQHQNATPAENNGATANLIGKSNQRAKVYGLIVAAGSDGLTGAELSRDTEIPRHVLSARLKELENDSLIFRSGDRRALKEGAVANSIYRKTPMEGRLL